MDAWRQRTWQMAESTRPRARPRAAISSSGVRAVIQAMARSFRFGLRIEQFVDARLHQRRPAIVDHAWLAIHGDIPHRCLQALRLRRPVAQLLVANPSPGWQDRAFGGHGIMREHDAAGHEFHRGRPGRESAGQNVPAQTVPQGDTGPEVRLRERDICPLLAAGNGDVLAVWAVLAGVARVATVAGVAGLARVPRLAGIACLTRVSGLAGLAMLARLTMLPRLPALARLPALPALAGLPALPTLAGLARLSRLTRLAVLTALPILARLPGLAVLAVLPGLAILTGLAGLPILARLPVLAGLARLPILAGLTILAVLPGLAALT